LSLIENGQRPVASPQRVDARERAIRRDDEVHLGELGAPHLGKLARRHGRRVGHEHRQGRGEALDLRLPVCHERGRHDQEVRRLAVGAVSLVQEQQPEHLDRLAEAHVVG